MRFEINTIGKHLIKRQTKELPKFIWGGMILLIVFYVGIKYGMEDKTFQFIMYLWAGFISLLIIVLGPIYVKSKINKVIQKIEFSDNKITIETKRGKSSLKDIHIQKVSDYFKGFGRSHMNGYIIKNKYDANEYWLIDSFFNENEDIEYELKKYSG